MSVEAADADLIPLQLIRECDFPKGTIGYKESLIGPLALHWKLARNKEVCNWIKMEVAEVSDLPEYERAIPGHWIFDVKQDPNGNVTKVKARCVAGGHLQTYGFDYWETYSATPVPEVARILLIIAAHKNWEVDQMDVDCAYLNAPLDKPVYMHIPPGIDIEHAPGQVFKLNKALYGLKQAGRQWSLHLKGLLEGIGWRQSKREPCLYTFKKDQHLLIYVDDLLIVASTKDNNRLNSSASNLPSSRQ